MLKFAAVAVLAFTTVAHAQLSADSTSKIDAAATKILADTGVPSANVGIVQSGKIVYTHAYGLAHLRPDVPATPDIAYPIGSISKQFTATAILLLQQDGKLKLDDPISKFFPELTRAKDITIRNILTMTSGYEDYAPQDYIIPAWLHETDPAKVVHEWAGKPLDFEPGTQWQYSNTNFVLAALIVEKVSGQKLDKFLHDRAFTPLHMDVVNTYTQRDKLRVTGYVSYALAPPREQPLEAPGWYYGDGDLSMSPATLLTWDLGIINQSLLTPESYKQMLTSFILKDGTDTHYGLGVFIGNRNGHRQIEHSGEVGGFVAENVIFPDDKLAITVLTNQVASDAASEIAAAIRPLVLPTPPAPVAPADSFAPTLQTIMTGFQTGKIDRTLFTADCNFYFDAPALADFQSTLGSMGTVTEVKRTRMGLRGGMEFGVYSVTFSGGSSVIVTTYRMKDGKIEQLLVVGKG